MRNVLLLCSVPVLAAALLATSACKKTVEVSETPDGGEPVISEPPVENGGETQADSGGGTPNVPAPPSGLPCDVEFLTELKCVGCHDGKMVSPALKTYEDFTAKSRTDPDKTVAQVSLDQIKAGTMPKPPRDPVSAEDIAVFEAWVNGGAAKNPNSCTTVDPDPDGGVLDGGGKSDGGTGIPGCTSGKTWTQGNVGSEEMNPGEACILCHTQNPRSPEYVFAGTVYATFKEPNDCYGKAPPPTITISITDARNQTYTMTANNAGNFHNNRLNGPRGPRPPFKVTISDGTKTRTMNTRVPHGDCNQCHTENGSNGTPGRILAPN